MNFYRYFIDISLVKFEKKKKKSSFILRISSSNRKFFSILFQYIWKFCSIIFIIKFY